MLFTRFVNKVAFKLLYFGKIEFSGQKNDIGSDDISNTNEKFHKNRCFIVGGILKAISDALLEQFVF